MDILLKLYVNEYLISNSITTASGVIHSKKEILIAFIVEENIQFAIELPLSPSSGETFEEIIEKFTITKFKESEHIGNAISYFVNMSLRPFNLKCCNESATYRTLGISDYYNDHVQGDYVKVKVSPDSISRVKSFLLQNQGKSRFILDFNGSLSARDFAHVIREFNKIDVFAIEQPVNYCSDNNLLLSKQKLYIADESLPKISYPLLKGRGYGGFVFKAFRNNYKSLTECSFNSDNLYGVIGTNMSGAFDVQFSSIINGYLPVEIKNYSLTSYFEDHPLNEKRVYLVKENRIRLSREAVDYINRHTSEIASFTVGTNQLRALYV